MELENTISEKFRKYLISIVVENEVRLTVWGTDMKDDETDKILINKKGSILTSNSFVELKEYLSQDTSSLFDSNNFESWLKETEDIQPYASYNLDKLIVLVNEGLISLQDISRDLCIEILDFMNLSQDFALQRNDDLLIEILESANNTIFKDYVYTLFLWDSDKTQIDEMNRLVISNFKNDLFIQDLRTLIDSFKSNLQPLN